MNVYVFWILFLSLWAIVPLMIIKGKADENPKIKTVPEVKTKKKGWFKQLIDLIKEEKNNILKFQGNLF